MASTPITGPPALERQDTTSDTQKMTELMMLDFASNAMYLALPIDNTHVLTICVPLENSSDTWDEVPESDSKKGKFNSLRWTRDLLRRLVAAQAEELAEEQAKQKPESHA